MTAVLRLLYVAGYMLVARRREAETRAALDEARRLLADADLALWEQQMARPS